MQNTVKAVTHLIHNKTINMQPETKTINGREITYKDVIHHDTRTVFDFKDRLKILFGKQVTICSEIYTQDECNVLASQAKVYLPPFIQKPQRGLYSISVNHKDSTNDQK